MSNGLITVDGMLFRFGKYIKCEADAKALLSLFVPEMIRINYGTCVVTDVMIEELFKGWVGHFHITSSPTRTYLTSYKPHEKDGWVFRSLLPIQVLEEVGDIRKIASAFFDNGVCITDIAD